MKKVFDERSYPTLSSRRKFLNGLVTLPLLSVQSASAKPVLKASEVTESRNSYKFENANVLNVRSFGAIGDGIADDTTAILTAICSVPPLEKRHPWLTRIVYFPSGKYKISRQLTNIGNGHFQPHLVLLGESSMNTTLVLEDNTLGFTNASQPRGIIYSTSGFAFSRKLDEGGRDYLGKGEGNEGFVNIIENLRIETGRGNVGAIGIDHLGNNLSAIRNVKVVGVDSVVGISLTRRWPGPLLISQVYIEGFKRGIDIGQNIYSVTIDKTTIAKTSEYGICNNGNIISLSELEIHPISGFCLANLTQDGLIAGIKVNFGGAKASYILNEGTICLDGKLTVDPSSSNNNLDFVAGKGVSNAIRSTVSDFPSIARTMHADAPTVFDFGISGNWRADATDLFQRAFSSSAVELIIPNGIYILRGSIEVSNSIERVEGAFSVLDCRGSNPPTAEALFRTLKDRTEPLMLRRFSVENFSQRFSYIIKHEGPSPLLISDVAGGAGLAFRTSTGGPLFAENTACQELVINGPAGAWLRQFNSEGSGVRIALEEADLWILGAKTEGNCTLVNNDRGSVSVVGGLVFRVSEGSDKISLIINRMGKVDVVMGEFALSARASYDVYYQSADEIYYASQAPRRKNGGRILILARNKQSDQKENSGNAQ